MYKIRRKRHQNLIIPKELVNSLEEAGSIEIEVESEEGKLIYELKKASNKTKANNNKSLLKYAGILNARVDALEFQKRIRSEWE